jgi:thiamine biosynthesis lipoprotein
MAMGIERSVEIAGTIDGLYYYFIYENPDGTIGIKYSDRFEQFLTD